MISYLIGLGVLFIILLAVSLLAAWFGASMYKTGHRDGYEAGKKYIIETDKIMLDAAEHMGVEIDLQRASHRRLTNDD